MNYFFQLLKNNVILLSIISSGGFSSVDLQNTDHIFFTDSGLRINNFAIGKNERFKYVDILLTEEHETIFIFISDDPKYYDDPSFYFDSTGFEKNKNPFMVNDVVVTHSRKDVGTFHEFEKSIRVSIHKSSAYGYMISLTIKDK